jgi:hypothetical protein
VTLSGNPEDRAAAGWIIADEIVRERTGGPVIPASRNSRKRE